MPPIVLRIDVLAGLSLFGLFLALWYVQQLWLQRMEDWERYPAWVRVAGAAIGTLLCYTVVSVVAG